MKDTAADEIVLKHLPPLVWVELDEDMKKQFPGAPSHNWFPLRPVVNNWMLDASENIEIARKGFAAVPDFSSTIHVATGRTLESCIADLGGYADVPSFPAMMRNYIALSRVRDKESILIARPFSPLLFEQGPLYSGCCSHQLLLLLLAQKCRRHVSLLAAPRRDAFCGDIYGRTAQHGKPDSSHQLRSSKGSVLQYMSSKTIWVRTPPPQRYSPIF